MRRQQAKIPGCFYEDKRKMTEFLIATMARLIKKAAKVRVSRDAALELSIVLEDYAVRVAREALKLTEHRGAKTLSKEDIKAAVSAISK